ncbi:hypothetical protein SDC9_148261 [bioreactor metagenome]|uniref:Uncharacterized protein n=1 Tax=bioreactor metagenome TaxID=1076179 RepID=A0A645EGL4_9ZZZZ
MRALALPIVEARLGDLRAALGVDDVQQFAEFLMVAHLEVELRNRADLAQFDIVGVGCAFRHIVRQQIGQIGRHRGDLAFQPVQPFFGGGQPFLEFAHCVARGRIVLAFLAQAIAFAAHGFDLGQKPATIGVERNQGVDIDRAAAPGAGFPDQIGIFAQ